jgi:hypothetical protein
MPGTTIGIRTKLLNSALNRKSLRTSPNAHAVPMKVAIGTVVKATTILVLKELNRK